MCRNVQECAGISPHAHLQPFLQVPELWGSFWPPERVLEVREELSGVPSPREVWWGRVRGHSLLGHDVVLGQGRALHPGHLHALRDLREVQAQVHTTDGHPGPSFRGPRHRQDLQGDRAQGR